MLIGINEKCEIKQMINISDDSLAKIDVDSSIFGNMSDFLILNFCYEPTDTGFSIYPSIDYDALIKIDSNEILSLQAQVVELEFEKRLAQGGI